MDVRRAGLAGIAFLVGVVAAAALLAGDDLLATVGLQQPVPLVVETVNTGPRTLGLEVTVKEVGGGTLQKWVYTLDAGATERRTLDETPPTQVEVWAEAALRPSGASRSQTTLQARPAACAEGEELLVRFVIDSTSGVSMQGSRPACV